MKMLSKMRVILMNKCRISKLKFFMLIVVIFSLYSFLSYIFFDVWYVQSKTKISVVPVKLDYVVMHVDLKGTPVKLTYLESLLPMLKENGVNCLLMEYEDMFPYEGKLVNMSAENCYGKQELKRFISTAVKSGFDIIPLVQTFGHLEFALKLPEFQHLREEPLHPDSICPSKPESIAVIRHMIEQVMDFHIEILPIKYIHIGCDEVFHTNTCQQCKKRSLGDTDIFLHHVKTLSDVIKSRHADTTVLIWDDMLRGINMNKWNNIDPFTNVQPVYWDYRSELLVSHVNLYKYHRHFKNIWIASAYKGADGISATFPDLRERYQNVYNWMSLISNYRFGGESEVYNFKGIILTGWSRYSHMDPPCELLPVSIPSLMLHLKVIQKFKSGVKETSDIYNDFAEDFYNKHVGEEVVKSLNCVIDIDNFDNFECRYDGMDLYELLKKYTAIANELEETINDDAVALKFVEYYSKLNFINKNSVSSNGDLIHKHLEEIEKFERNAHRLLSKYYSSDFVTEYIHCKTFHMKNKIKNLQNIYDGYQNVSVWKRRPKNITHLMVN